MRHVLRMLQDDGWIQCKGKKTGHRQFKHPKKKGKVTVSGHPSHDVLPKTLASIKKQAGLD